MRGLSAGRGIAAASATLSHRPQRSESRRGPLTLASLDLSPRGGERCNSSSFSRCGFASEFCHATARKPFQRPPSNCPKTATALPKRREAERRQAHHWFPPRRRKISLPAYAARAMFRPRPRIGAGLKGRRARLSAPHRGHAPRGLSLDSAPGRASWNHRIQTGGPSPAPVQPAPGSPITRRTVDAQNRPEPRCMAALPGTALVPLSKVPSRKAPP